MLHKWVFVKFLFSFCIKKNICRGGEPVVGGAL